MGFKAIGGFLLSIGCSFNIILGIFILSVFTFGIIIATVIFSLNDTGINNTGLTVFDNDTFGIKLMIDIVK